ncbi:MFS transporter [Agreia sp. PsM10]|uniref:MFS transporter n=1 Tax=Agreia sp. PsM10 TaxID=3030533 RepID=UPI00263B986A|nr:MFS transporter [Agreia sp. PsM10]MDN4640053.1 MFS transporter [Agreia sp. PsM10]
MSSSMSTAPTNADASPQPEKSARLGATMGLAVLGVFVTYVPITGVAASLSTISGATGASTSDLQWISDAYVIPMAAAVLSAGVFGDIHGRRRVYSLGMLLTVVGAMISGLSSVTGDSAIYVLWGGQAVSGLGAGLLLPTTLALIAYAVPDPHERGKYVGMWATGMAVGLAVGPLVSSAILSFAGWGWIFAPSIVLSLSAGILAYFTLPESKNAAGRHLDWPGQITATIAIASSIFGVIEGGSKGWDSIESISGLGIGAVAFVAFIVVESRSTAPLMDLRLYRSAAFTAAGFSALVALFSVVGTMFLLSVFFGSVLHLDILDIGIRLLFVTGVTAVANPLVARLMTKVKPLHILVSGLALCAVALFLLTGFDTTTSFGDLVWRLAIFGLSLSLMLTPVSVVAINSVPWQQAGMASAANTALRQYGGALGPAVLGAIFISQLNDGMTASDALHTALITNMVLLAIAAIVCVIAVVVQRASSAK